MKKTILIFTLISIKIFALDTIETFNLGFTDFEYYSKITNLNRKDKEFINEIHIGAGITSIFSAHLSLSNEKLNNNLPTSSYSFGFIFNPLNTKYIDIDFYGELNSNYDILIGIELNYDLKDNLKYLGFYFRPEIELNNDSKFYKILFGSYYNLTTNIQLLTEFNASKEENYNLEIENISFGINYTLCKSIELINEFSIDIPKKNKNINYSITIGFLATL